MFHIEMLPAERGDCLLLEYGDPAQPQRILIDGGPNAAYPQLRERILRIPEGQRNFELLVVTHMDQDHIEGVIRLLNERGELGVRFEDVWFNGLRHLSEEQLGFSDAEVLTHLLDRQLPWNEAFHGKAAVVPEDGPLPTYTLPGGMQLTLLSPTTAALRALLVKWNEVVRTRGRHSEAEEKGEEDSSQLTLGEPGVEELARSKFRLDSSLPNCSSIAFLAEYDGKRFLATGDAFPTVLSECLTRGFGATVDNRLRVHAFKPSHHGSRGSLNIDLVQQLNCDHFLISTNGYRFKHPTREAVSRILLHSQEGFKLWFNYHTDFNKEWENRDLRARYHYDVEYPTASDEGVRITLVRGIQPCL
jgi:beta-lactamase superfamily II metal-dependent hydrolase